MKVIMLAFAFPIAAFAQTAPPSPTPPPSASATPSPPPSVSATPFPAPTPLPTPLVLPPPAPPQILAVKFRDSVLHSGDTMLVTVITSTNVAAVELRVGGSVIRFPRTDFGIWQLSYKLPPIPRRFRHDYAAEIVAWNSTNLTAKRDVTIALR